MCKTPHEWRFNWRFVGPIICLWGRTTILSNVTKRSRSSASVRSSNRIFIGYALKAVRSWTGDLLIVDTEGLQTTPPSEIRVNRFKSKKSGHFKKEKQWICSFHARRAKSCKMDSRHPPRCVQKFGRDLWGIVGNYENGRHVAPSTELHVSNEDFPIPQNYCDVQRQTKTSIDVHHEAPSDDYWNICGDKSLSGHLIGVTRFE